MRFFKSCRIVKRTRAREMLFRLIVLLAFDSVGLAPRTSSPWASHPAGTCNPVDPGNPSAPTERSGVGSSIGLVP